MQRALDVDVEVQQRASTSLLVIAARREMGALHVDTAIVRRKTLPRGNREWGGNKARVTESLGRARGLRQV